ncbi:MAG: tetratricopeptide repeat protein [candidate division WOR-3 bacterium]|nr:MAG: tetratricopeptide repeat protein [candidate division WOR-3 bacterium]
MKKLIFLGIVFLFIACPPTAKNAARIYIQQGEYEAAKEQIMIGLQSAPNDYEYYVLLSKVEIGMADWLAATDAFYRGIAVDSGKTVNWLLSDKQNIPVYWQAFYNAAISLMNAKQYDRALKNLGYCELFDPKNVSQYILEGGIYGELGEKEKAGAAYVRALSIDPENPEAYFMVGRAKFDKGAYDSAIVDLREAEKFFLTKYDRTARIVFQNLPAVDKNISKEIMQLWGEKNEEALDVLVKVKLGFDGGLEPHRRTLEQFYKTTDGLSRAYYYTGMAYYNLRNDSLALSNFLKSLDLKADDADALYYAGEIYLKQKKYDESMKMFRKITEFREDDAYAWFYLGVNHTQKKEYQKAVEIYENKVLVLDPQNLDAMTNLAYVYREMGNNKKALEWLTKAEKLQKEQ